MIPVVFDLWALRPVHFAHIQPKELRDTDADIDLCASGIYPGNGLLER